MRKWDVKWMAAGHWQLAYGDASAGRLWPSHAITEQTAKELAEMCAEFLNEKEAAREKKYYSAEGPVGTHRVNKRTTGKIVATFDDDDIPDARFRARALCDELNAQSQEGPI